MKLGKKHIFIVGGILLGFLLIYWLYMRLRKAEPKGISEIQTKTETITSVSTANNPDTPPMYGAQNVLQDAYGIWRLAPNTCNLITTGIIDWAAVRALSDVRKDQLYRDIDNCSAESLPLLQP